MIRILLCVLLGANAYAETKTTTATTEATEKIQLEVYAGYDAAGNIAHPLQVLNLETARPDLYQVTVRYGAHKNIKFTDDTFWKTAYIAEFERPHLAKWLQCVSFDSETHTCASLLNIDLSNLKKKRGELTKAVVANFDWAKDQKVLTTSQLWVNGQRYDRPLAYGQLLNDLNEILPKTARLQNLGTFKMTKLYAVGNTQGLGMRDLALEREFSRWIPKLEFEPVSPESKQGQKLLKAAEAKAIPAYIFDRNSRDNYAVQKLTTAGRATIKKSGYGVFDLRSGGTEIKLAGSTLPKTLDLWVMSQCPYGVKAETALMAAIEQKLLPEGTTVRLRYIANEDKGEWTALHGEPELTENIRQLAIQATWPEKLWTYLKARNVDYNSEDWQSAAKTAGLDPKQVESKMSLGRKLMAKDIKDGAALNISGSPTYLWENTYVLQTEQDFKATVGYNPQTIKTAQVEATVSSRKPASAPAGGQCGG